jgi:hypothetical protein
MKKPRHKELTPESFLETLDAMRARFLERTGSYKHGYRKLGRMLMELFPDGIKFETEEEAVGFFFIFMNLVKLVRYSDNLKTGHKDSTHDMAVYATMLDSIEQDPNQGPPKVKLSKEI